MIRVYSTDDLNGVLELVRLNTPKYFHPSEIDDFKTYLETEVEDYFVVEVDEQIIGAGGLNYFPNRREACISWGVIHPDYQKKGIGTLLTKHRTEIARKNEEVDTLIVRTSQLTFTFYEKMGFQLIRTEKDFWEKGYDLHELSMNVKM